MTLDENRNSVAQYDILNYCNLPSGLQHLVKVGKFVPQAPHGQELTIHEEIIDWAIGFEEVSHSFKDGIFTEYGYQTRLVS